MAVEQLESQSSLPETKNAPIRNKDSFVQALSREVLGMEPVYTVKRLDDPDQIDEARAFAAQGFSSLGKIPLEALENGLPKVDRLHDDSTYFAVYDGDKIKATVRYHWRPDLSIDDTRMPLEQLSGDSRELLHNMPNGSIAEIGNLYKQKGFGAAPVVLMLADMFADAKNKGIVSFTAGLEPNVYERSFRDMFGGSLKLLADHTVNFPGVKGPQVPLMIDIQHVVRNQLLKKFDDKPVKVIGAEVQTAHPKTRLEQLGSKALRFALAGLFYMRMRSYASKEKELTADKV